MRLIDSLHEMTLPNLQNKCQQLSQAIVQHELDSPRACDIEAAHLVIDALLLPSLSSATHLAMPREFVTMQAASAWRASL